MDENQLATEIIGAAIEVHRQLGPGLLEAVYRDCLVYELKDRGINVERERTIPVRYKGLELPAAYRADLIVSDSVIVELKAVDILLPVHAAQLLSYLRISEKKLGLLINFNMAQLREGIRRIVNQL
jgi:GxxExxY protein